jgi:hypothetical protein
MELQTNDFQDMVYDMILIQDALGQAQHPRWRSQKYDLGLAATEEVFEMLEHTKWHWWKNAAVTEADIDWESVHYELADVFNFMVSDLLVTFSHEHVVKDFVDGYARLKEYGYAVRSVDRIRTVSKDLIESLLHGTDPFSGGYPAYNFLRLMQEVGLSMERLYDIYRAKAELNFFRWENGFKEGTYTRMWMGQKDDVYLRNIVNMTNPKDPNYSLFIRQGLASLYAEVTRPKDMEPKQVAQNAPLRNLRNGIPTRAPRPPHETGHTPPDVA